VVSQPTAIDFDHAPTILRGPTPQDTKYSRGVVACVTGSTPYPGAALLSVGAVLATGVGMVRYLGPDEVTSLVVTAYPEVVVIPGRQDAAVVGSGFPRVSESDCRERVGPLGDMPLPVVLDAGAMEHRLLFPGPAILTPHLGELARLADVFGAPEGDPAGQAFWLSHHLDATVVVKGHETLVVSPSGHTSRLSPAPTWLATAGTGDVLAGIMGAVLAQVSRNAGEGATGEAQCHDVAILGCLIHQEAARRASRSDTSQSGKPLTASGLIGEIPEVVATLVDRV
jgi:ADP-dependent NAD(P)H-hydrate dehydratase / NAD(P)H-hydrate epimerase